MGVDTVIKEEGEEESAGIVVPDAAASVNPVVAMVVSSA
jgi:hypothetical protein